MTPDRVGDQQHPQESRRRRQELDPMRVDRRANRVRLAVARGDDTAAVAQHMQERVEAADMVHQQKGQRPVGRPLRSEFLQNPAKIEHRRLAFAGRARTEQDQSGSAPLDQGAQQRMSGPALIGQEAPLVVAVELNGVSDFGRLHHAIPTARARERQRDDDGAVQQRREQQRARVGRIVAADRHHVAGNNPVSRQFGAPRLDGPIQFKIRPAGVAPNQRRTAPPIAQALSQPVLIHRTLANVPTRLGRL